MIILAIVGFLAFIASIRFKITIEYNESLCVYLRILQIFRIAITPRKEKKIKISDYSEKAMTKKQKAMAAREAQKAQKKQAKKQQKLEKKKYKKEHPEEFQHERTLSENISLIIDIVKVLLRRFFKHLRIDLARIHISIAGKDAAQTAILYGVVCQSVAYLVELLNRFKTVSTPDYSDISVTPDWVGEKIKIDVKISFSMRIGQLFDILGHVAWRAIKRLFHDMKKKKDSLPPNVPSLKTEKPILPKNGKKA